jgi:hypothetical protein
MHGEQGQLPIREGAARRERARLIAELNASRQEFLSKKATRDGETG